MLRPRIFCRWLGILCVLACASWNLSPAQAQRLHAVVCGDSSDWAGWGKYAPNIGIDMVWMYSILHRNVPRRLLEYHSLPMETDQASSPQFIMQQLDEVQPGPHDTLLFYFTGHGAADDRGHYLSLAQGPLYRSDLLRQLQAKGARLTVLLTDCCNTRSDGQAFGHRLATTRSHRR